MPPLAAASDLLQSSARVPDLLSKLGTSSRDLRRAPEYCRSDEDHRPESYKTAHSLQLGSCRAPSRAAGQSTPALWTPGLSEMWLSMPTI
eukprot:4969058-Amphidinium_carterae.1